MKDALRKATDWLRNAWKAVIALAVPILWDAGIDLFTGLQGTVVDNAVAVGVVGFVLVWLKANRPKPV